MLGLGLTGYLLPWDNKAYFATKVTLEIANTVPWLGPIIKEFLQGGTIVGAQTLTRFFALRLLPSRCASGASGRTLHHDPQTGHFGTTIT